MKNKIEKLYAESVSCGDSPESFSKKVLSLFGLNTEGSLSLPFNAIIHPHFDSKHRIDGGIIIENGIVTGHADSIGEEGAQGCVGMKTERIDESESITGVEIRNPKFEIRDSKSYLIGGDIIFKNGMKIGEVDKENKWSIGTTGTIGIVG